MTSLQDGKQFNTDIAGGFDYEIQNQRYKIHNKLDGRTTRKGKLCRKSRYF
jgi:hypothetical protein